MATAIIQPIAGVSANRETEIEAIYPSIAGGAIGGLIGTLMAIPASLPTGQGIAKPIFLAVKLTVYVIFGGALLPLAVLAYAFHKLTGRYYLLTNRSIQDRTILGGAMSNQLALAEIQNIEISSSTAYQFYKVGDVHLQNAQGQTLMSLKAIQRPERLSQILIDAREARTRSDASLAVIQARR